MRSVHTDFFVFILSLICFSEKTSYGDKDIEPEQPPRDSLLQLVSLQKASGCWELDPALAAALGKTSEEVENTKPSSVGYCQILQECNSTKSVHVNGVPYRLHAWTAERIKPVKLNQTKSNMDV